MHHNTVIYPCIIYCARIQMRVAVIYEQIILDQILPHASYVGFEILNLVLEMILNLFWSCTAWLQVFTDSMTLILHVLYVSVVTQPFTRDREYEASGDIVVVVVFYTGF